jgi:hypothetical protein
MNTPPPDLIEAVERAAELRAVGHGWEYVARELNRPPDTVRGWPRRYREFWDHLIAIHDRDQTGAARAEARDYLRKLLRSDNAKAGQFAAKELFAADAPASAAATEPAPMSDFCRFAARLEELSDDELRKLLDDVRRRDDAGRNLQPRAEPDPPVAA